LSFSFLHTKFNKMKILRITEKIVSVFSLCYCIMILLWLKETSMRDYQPWTLFFLKDKRKPKNIYRIQVVDMQKINRYKLNQILVFLFSVSLFQEISNLSTSLSTLGDLYSGVWFFSQCQISKLFCFWWICENHFWTFKILLPLLNWRTSVDWVVIRSSQNKFEFSNYIGSVFWEVFFLRNVKFYFQGLISYFQ